MYLEFSLNFDSSSDESFTSDGAPETPVDWIPGLTNVRFKDLPSFLRTNNPAIMFDFMGEESQKCLNAPAIIFNTFDTMELEVLGAIAAKHPRIYTIGPLPLLCRRQVTNPAVNSLNPSLWKEEPDCLEWLDRREPGSVVYVNYGSIAVMTAEQLREFAWGLANSRHPFLWIVRPDVVIGDSAALPEEFLEKIKERGRLSGWCNQEEVVAHPSVGAFLTHCGWNSVMEAVCGGVPVICWPFFADQFTNCRYACANWGIGVEVDGDVKRGNVEALVREVMEGNGGKEMKKKAREWKKKAEEAIDVGGSSHCNFDRLVKVALGYEG
ncbi:7-deoxyloganetin glucosyltransferase [Sarracenia purpurea var. burkii]